MTDMEFSTFKLVMLIFEGFIPSWSSPSLTTLLIAMVWTYIRPWKYTTSSFCVGSFLVIGVAMVTSWGGWFILSAFYWYLVVREVKRTWKLSSF